MKHHRFLFFFIVLLPRVVGRARGGMGLDARGGTGRRRQTGADGDVPDGAHRRVRGVLRAGAAALQAVVALELCRPGARRRCRP